MGSGAACLLRSHGILRLSHVFAIPMPIEITHANKAHYQIESAGAFADIACGHIWIPKPR